MKKMHRIFSILLAAALLISLAPAAMAANGATITVQLGETRRFELYPKSKDNWGTAGSPYLERDFSAASTGDEKIARVVDQMGVLQIVGNAIGMTEYEATTVAGETYTGHISVINNAALPGSIEENRGSTWINGGRGGFEYCVDYYVAEPVDVISYLITPETEKKPPEVQEIIIPVTKSDSYGRVSFRFKKRQNNDITLSATGNIRVDENGYFFKEGEAASVRPGYATKVWGGAITMTSPTMGTEVVYVYLS